MPVATDATGVAVSRGASGGRIVRRVGKWIPDQVRNDKGTYFRSDANGNHGTFTFRLIIVNAFTINYCEP